MKYRHISTICICILIYLLFFVYKTILQDSPESLPLEHKAYRVKK
nr:MAG TPA_asm: hypothetical protein [Caudoviricetes sp.]